MTETSPTLNDIANLFDNPQNALELLTHSQKEDGKIYLGSQGRSATISQFYNMLYSGRREDKPFLTADLFRLQVLSMIPNPGMQSPDLRKGTADPSRRCPRYPDLKWYDKNME